MRLRLLKRKKKKWSCNAFFYDRERDWKMYQLVLAEKPSVAQSIAKVIGATGRKDGYLEGNGYVVSWCVGHLVELAAADQYDPRYSKWQQGDLPIIPEMWKFQIARNTKKQFEILKALMERSDVTELIEATDAGREGELIFRLVYSQSGCRKPFKRLWISSMEDSAIQKGFSHLIDGTNYDNLYHAALCRSKADWLVGINGTRLFTTLYHGKTLNVGRVMTPTLALLTERETSILHFKKEKFYMLELECDKLTFSSDRISSKSDAEKLRKTCIGKPAVVQTITHQEKTENPPKLYDLTTLQREANRIYGYTAKQTLDYVQLLYEKKWATYPRTDSRYITEDMADGIPSLCETIGIYFPFLSDLPIKVDTNQVVDNSSVSDHHAILPTKEIAHVDFSALPTGERNLLYLIGTRLLCSVCPDKYVYSDTEVILDCSETTFKAKGRTEIASGWKMIEQRFQASLKEKKKEGQLTPPLPEMKEKQIFMPGTVNLREKTTSPPKRFTEDSLLSAMENAGAEDFAQIEGLERKGLGTSATRASIIERLVNGGFVERKNKQLIPTTRGIELIKVLPDSIKSAKLTAEWESALKEVECGRRSPDNFMSGIILMVDNLVKSYKGIVVGADEALSQSSYEIIGKCPRCGKPVYEGKKGFYCSGYKNTPPCGFNLWKDNLYFRSKRKELTKKVAATLLKDGRIYMTGLFSEKKGIFYDATIVMDDTGGKYVNFKMEFDSKKKAK